MINNMSYITNELEMLGILSVTMHNGDVYQLKIVPMIYQGYKGFFELEVCYSKINMLGAYREFIHIDDGLSNIEIARDAIKKLVADNRVFYQNVVKQFERKE